MAIKSLAYVESWKFIGGDKVLKIQLIARAILPLMRKRSATHVLIAFIGHVYRGLQIGIDAQTKKHNTAIRA